VEERGKIKRFLYKGTGILMPRSEQPSRTPEELARMAVAAGIDPAAYMDAMARAEALQGKVTESRMRELALAQGISPGSPIRFTPNTPGVTSKGSIDGVVKADHPQLRRFDSLSAMQLWPVPFRDASDVTRIAREWQRKAEELEGSAQKILKWSKELKNLAGERESKEQEIANESDPSERRSLEQDLNEIDRQCAEIAQSLLNEDPETKALRSARAVLASSLSGGPAVTTTEQVNNAIQNAVGEWERKTRATDERFVSVIEKVKGRISELIKAEGHPTDPEKAVEMAQRAYKEVILSSPK
jgi:hypothetical protein